jgi:hypothetical protein
LGHATDKAPKGEYFNYRKTEYWAKECRQPKRERNIPVQVSIIETTERELLPIPEVYRSTSNPDTLSARIYLACTITQDLLDKQEHGLQESSTSSTSSTSTKDSD